MDAKIAERPAIFKPTFWPPRGFGPDYSQVFKHQESRAD